MFWEIHDSVFISFVKTDQVVEILVDPAVVLTTDEAESDQTFFRKLVVTLNIEGRLPNIGVQGFEASDGYLKVGGVTHQGLLPLPFKTTESGLLHLEVVGDTGPLDLAFSEAEIRLID